MVTNNTHNGLESCLDDCGNHGPRRLGSSRIPLRSMKRFIAYGMLDASFPRCPFLSTELMQSVRTMKRILVTAVAAVGLGLFTAQAQAGEYAENGRNASPEQIQFLSARGALPGPAIVTGHWSSSTDPKTTPGGDDRGCWYDPDLPNCE
jgi:hypothetical protein